MKEQAIEVGDKTNKGIVKEVRYDNPDNSLSGYLIDDGEDYYYTLYHPSEVRLSEHTHKSTEAEAEDYAAGLWNHTPTANGATEKEFKIATSAYIAGRSASDEAKDGRIRELTEFLKDVANNWDCDTGANGTHHLQCRSCKAKNILNKNQ